MGIGRDAPIPGWLRFVLKFDRAGSAWYIGSGFFFAPVLAALSPWPTVTAVLWGLIGVAGLWLGLLGLAMATGLSMVLRSNTEIPEEYWRSIVHSAVPCQPSLARPAQKDTSTSSTTFSEPISSE